MGGGHLEHELGVTLPLDGEHALAAVVNCFISGGISQERTLTRCDLKKLSFQLFSRKKTQPYWYRPLCVSFHAMIQSQETQWWTEGLPAATGK